MSRATQRLDLGGFAFSSGESVTWTQSGTSGTLTVSDGAKVAQLTLIGTYATGDFQLSTDGHGGTFVDDPPAHHAAPAAANFAQTVAGLTSDGAGFATIHTRRGSAVMNGAMPLLTATTSGR